MKSCRACMDDTKSNLQALVASDELFDLFNEFTRLNIYVTDGLPNWLCKCCVSQLGKFKIFREQCINSSIELKLKLGINNVGESSLLAEIATVFVDDKQIETEDEDSATSDHDFDGVSNRSRKDVKNKTIKRKVGDKILPTQTQTPLYIKVRKKTNSNKLQLMRYQKNQSFAYRCDDCGRGFHYRERYEGHLREHEGKPAAVCEFCNGEYSNWFSLQKHMVLMHESEMKHVCNDCGKKFIYESGLTAHRSSHFGPRKHMCEQCGRAFINTYALSKHKLSHTTEAPYECNICGKKFKCEAHLKAHDFRHMGIKQFSCRICSKSFTTRPELKQHMRVHSSSSIKQFQCPICERHFKQKNQLSVHERSCFLILPKL